MSAALTLNPFWQLKILVKEDPDRLRSLPLVVDREALAAKIKAALGNPSLRRRLLRPGEGDSQSSLLENDGKHHFEHVPGQFGGAQLGGVSVGEAAHLGTDKDISSGLSLDGDFDLNHSCPECEKMAGGFKKFLIRLQEGEHMGALETECPAILKLLRRSLE